MKIYQKTTSERTAKGVGQGGNKELRSELYVGNTKKDSKEVLTMIVKVMPPEASITNKECVVIQLWGEDGELCERLVYSLPSMKQIHNRAEALAIGERQKGKQWTCGVCGTRFQLLPHSQKCPNCGETVG